MTYPKVSKISPQLVDWAEGRLGEEEARIFEEGMASDGATRATADWLRKFVGAAEGRRNLESPPPQVREALVARFEAHAEGRRTPGFLERLFATLTFDGGLQPAVGMRAAGGQGSRRQLAYSTSAADVALSIRLRSGGGDLDVRGQVFPHGGESQVAQRFGVQLLRDGAEVAITATDDLGAFAFEAVEPGVYEVPIGAAGVEILLAPVELRV